MRSRDGDSDSLRRGLLWLLRGPLLLDVHGTVCSGLLRLLGDCAHIANVYRSLRDGSLLPGRIGARDSGGLRGWLLRRNDRSHHIDVHGAVRCGFLRLRSDGAHSSDVRRSLRTGPLLPCGLSELDADHLPSRLLLSRGRELTNTVPVRRLHVSGSLGCSFLLRDGVRDVNGLGNVNGAPHAQRNSDGDLNGDSDGDRDALRGCDRVRNGDGLIDWFVDGLLVPLCSAHCEWLPFVKRRAIRVRVGVSRSVTIVVRLGVCVREHIRVRV